MPNHDSPHFDFSDDPQVTGTKTAGTGTVLGVILLSLGSAFFLADTLMERFKEPAAKATEKTTPPSPAASAPKAAP